LASEIKSPTEMKYYGQDTLYQVHTALPITSHLTLLLSKLKSNILTWLTSTDILSNIRRRVSSLRMWYLCFSTLLFSSSTRSCLSLSNLFFFPANRDSISHSNWSSWGKRNSYFYECIYVHLIL